MAEREQVRPLAPASERPISSDDDETALHHHQQQQVKKNFHRKRCIKCCIGITASSLLIIAIVMVILIFTVFKIKDPVIKLNGVTVDKLELMNGTSIPRPGSNITLTADVSVKNPNYASFRYRNTTTTLFYRETMIGEARGPPGKSKARRTMQMNITVHIITSRLITHPMLTDDISGGLLPMTTYTRVGGRVKILKLIDKYIVVKMNCSMSVNTTSRTIQDQKCKRKVQF